ncbi:MAG: TraR/DksA C4-type zinc finger protein [Candidatus Zixiibacteriota bacterium]
MKKSDLDKFKKLLLDKRHALLEEMGYLEEAHGATIKEATGDLTHYSYHMADQGTDNMEREMAFAHGSKSRRLLYHIDEALRRIEDGTYGKCHTCGKQIQVPRLTAVPHARLCIECKSAEEEAKTGRKAR